VIFGLAYARAVQRSRSDELHLAGLFFLAGSAPRDVQRSLLGAMVVQLVVGVGAASLRPFTPLAFGTLVPVFGLAVAALWSATHGTFPPRRHDRPTRAAATATSGRPGGRPRRAGGDGRGASGGGKAAEGTPTPARPPGRGAGNQARADDQPTAANRVAERDRQQARPASPRSRTRPAPKRS
jgi:hypothetical protein